MKKSIPLLLVLLLFASGCKQADTIPPVDAPVILEESQSPAVETSPETAYFSVLEVLRAKQPSNTSNQKMYACALADLDGEGVRELMATYPGIDGFEQRVEIWTVQDGALALLWEQTLFVNAGAPVGGVCLVAKDGTNYLCVYEANVDGSVGTNENRMDRHTGTLRFFSLGERMPENTPAAGALKQAHWLHYDFSGPDERTPSNMHAQPELLFDGNPCDLSVFNDWMAAFDAPAETYLTVGRDLYIGRPFEDGFANISKK